MTGEPDRREPGGETADVMVARLVVERLDVPSLPGKTEYLALCTKHWTKVQNLKCGCLP